MSKVWHRAGYIEGLGCPSWNVYPSSGHANGKHQGDCIQFLSNSKSICSPHEWSLNSSCRCWGTQVPPECPLREASMLGWVWRVYVYLYVFQRNMSPLPLLLFALLPWDRVFFSDPELTVSLGGQRASRCYPPTTPLSSTLPPYSAYRLS